MPSPFKEKKDKYLESAKKVESTRTSLISISTLVRGKSLASSPQSLVPLNFLNFETMASSDDFREKLKAGNITEALALALSEAVELKITTWVASAEDDIEAKPGHRLRTRINLVDGDIENEIGDQFIGSGSYKELRQFHLEQVAEGNKIIQNNLKSLQKLFEVLVALRYPSAHPPVIEPESGGNESPILPPAPDVTAPGTGTAPQGSAVEDAVVIPSPLVETITGIGTGIAPQESAVEDSVVLPNTVVDNVTDAGIGTTPQGSVVEDAVVVPTNPLVEQNVTPPTPPFEELSSPTTPADSKNSLDSEIDEEDDDWDNSVLDLLESLPVAPPPTTQILDGQMDEDWDEFVPDEPEPDQPAARENQDWGNLSLEDFESPPASPEPNPQASSFQSDEDWDEFVPDEPEPDQPAARENQDWGNLSLEDFESPPALPEPNRQMSSFQSDEDWGDLVEDEPEPDQSISESRENQAREIVSEVENIPSPPASPQLNIEALNSQIDNEDWGDLVEDEPESDKSISELRENQAQEIVSEVENIPSPPASPQPNIEVLNSQIDDEDWGDLVDEEPEPATEKSFPSLESLDLEEDDDWADWVVEESEPLLDAPVVDIEPLDLGDDDDWGDLDDEFEAFPPAPALNDSPPDLEIDAESDLHQTDNADLRENLEIHSPTPTPIDPLEELERSPQVPEMSESPTPEESEKGDLSKESDPQAVSENDLDTHPKPVGRRVPPPPPPPNRFLNPNN